MTDRHSGYTVVLDKDVREDDAESIRLALSMVKGVHSVIPHVANHDLAVAERRVRREMEDRLYAALSKDSA